MKKILSRLAFMFSIISIAYLLLADFSGTPQEYKSLVLFARCSGISIQVMISLYFIKQDKEINWIE